MPDRAPGRPPLPKRPADPTYLGVDEGGGLERAIVRALSYLGILVVVLAVGFRVFELLLVGSALLGAGGMIRHASASFVEVETQDERLAVDFASLMVDEVTVRVFATDYGDRGEVLVQGGRWDGTLWRVLHEKGDDTGAAMRAGLRSDFDAVVAALRLGKEPREIVGRPGQPGQKIELLVDLVLAATRPTAVERPAPHVKLRSGPLDGVEVDRGLFDNVGVLRMAFDEKGALAFDSLKPAIPSPAHRWSVALYRLGKTQAPVAWFAGVEGELRSSIRAGE
jgi:hypothetical protein